MRTKEDLRQMQALPLGAKISMTKNRIREWVREYGESGVYVSFSGGKDSTVLLHIVRSMFPNVEAVFVNTGLEYPEIQQFVKSFDNVTILRPKMRFDEVIKKYGYPIIGKSQADAVYLGRKNLKENKYSLRLMSLGIDVDEAKKIGLTLPSEQMLERYARTRNGSKYNAQKYKPLLEVDFETSAECCAVMKKRPLKQYEKETGKKPFIATMASESMLRETNWIKSGCNAFDDKHPKSMPLSFWTEQDILQYIKFYIEIPLSDAWTNIHSESKRFRKAARKKLKSFGYREHAIAPVYGEIVYTTDPEQMRFEELGFTEYGTERLTTTGCDRTGCIFCVFGCHLEKSPSRFERLKETHPRQYKYCISGGEYVTEWYELTKDGKQVKIDGEPLDGKGYIFKRVWKPNKNGLGMGHVFNELNKIYGDGFIKY